MSGLLSPFLTSQRFLIVLPELRGNILDLGCGLAHILDWLPAGQPYTGVEGNPKIIEWLLANRPGNNFIHLNLDQGTLSLNRRFDTILMLAVIEHLHHPEKVLNAIPSHLKERGKFVITTPSIFGNFIHRIGTGLRLFSKYAAEEHAIIYTRSRLGTLLNSCGLKIDVFRSFLLGSNHLYVCSPCE